VVNAGRKQARRPDDPAPLGTRERGGWALVVGQGVLVMVSLLVLCMTGYAWVSYQNLNNGIHKSTTALSGVQASTNGDTNILIMGLDSRLDENGNPLPAAIYNALHAGDSSDGGQNSNVLILLHVPGDGSKATAISIPRDDYVPFPGCPDGQCGGKVKQAYGLAFDQEAKRLANQGISDSPSREQQQRDAGRKAEIATVQQFLGGVAIDHFVEVTLVAFFQIAQVVQPITVCALARTQDTFSGANFQAGKQQIDASQALAFVRQRRDNVAGDPYYNNFTDLDRERRQQAFIASLAYQLKQGGTFTDPTKLSGIMAVSKQNTAVDSGMDLLDFAQQASGLTSGNITFYTLPIDHFGTDPLGEDVNIVNTPLIQSTVHSLLTGGSATTSAAPTTTTPPPTTPAGPPAVVDAVNASGVDGLASQVEKALAHNGFTQGTASTRSTHRTSSVIEYGPGASDAADRLAKLLGGGITTESDTAVAAGMLRFVIGTDFSLPSSLGGAGASTTTPPPATAVSGANQSAGADGPPPDALSALSGGGVPCVK
jgi:LCP family protein required for cell wall assembly